jgi:hypothetical protein
MAFPWIPQEQARTDFEHFKCLVKLEKRKFEAGLLWILMALAPFIYWRFYPINIDQNGLPILLAIISYLFALMLIGVTQLVQGLSSNAVETDKFQQNVMSKLDLLLEQNGKLRSEKPKEIPVISNTIMRGEPSEFFIKIGFVIFVIAYIVWLLWTMYQHSTDPQYITTALIAIPSFFVAVVTFLYVLLTRDLVKTNQELVVSQREHDLLLLSPIGKIHISYTDQEYVITIENNGMGPLIIKSIKIDKKEILKSDSFITEDWPPLSLIEKCDHMKTDDILRHIENYTIFPGKSIAILQYKIDPTDNQQKDEFKSKILKLGNIYEIRFEYTDILGKNTWVEKKPLLNISNK